MDSLIEHAKRLAEQDNKYRYLPIKNRVAYVVSHAQSYASNGYAIRTQGIAEALRSAGFDPICFVRPGRTWELNSFSDINVHTKVNGIRHIHIPWFNAPKKEIERLEQTADIFTEQFRIFRPSSIFVATNYLIGLPAYVAASRLGIPLINEVREFRELSRDAREPGYKNTAAFNKEQERNTFVANQAEQVITLNSAMRAELINRGVIGDKIQLVPNAVNELPKIAKQQDKLKRSLGITEKDNVLGFVGSFSPNEGLDLLLQACYELVQKGENLKLLLVGDDQPLTLNNKIGYSVAQLVKTGLKETLPWLIQVGRVPHDQVADYYALMDAVVIPRMPMTVCQLVPPMKAAEALAYGKQLVVSNVEPLAEYANKYEGVLSFEAGSVTSLALALQNLLKLPASKPSNELLLSAHIAPLIKALKVAEEKQSEIRNSASESSPKELTKLVDAKPTSLVVQLPFSESLNVNFCLMSEKIKKKETPWTHVNVAGVKKISIRAESKSKIADKKIILRIQCFNRDGQEVEPVKGTAYFSEIYKWFRYVTVNEKDGGDSGSSVYIPVSDTIVSIGFSFVNLGDVNTGSFTASLKKEFQSATEAVDKKKRHEDIFDFLHSASVNKVLQTRALIYGDVSPNVLDGSSIWLTSVTNIVSSTRPTLLLLKDNINNSKVVSNIERHNRLTIVQPRDIGFNAPLDQQAAAEALSLIHAHCPQVTALITRGVDLSYEIQKRKEFTGIFYPYLTDFYEVTEQGFSLVDAKVKKLKEVVLNARSILFQTEEIHKKLEEIVGYELDGAKLPPSIPDNLVKISESDEKNRDDVIHIGYAGKVQPRWGVEELIEEVEKQLALGRKIKLHIATGKIHGRGKEGVAFVQRIRCSLKKSFVHLHESLSREAAMSLMAQMDLVWCYRDPILENSTLELSTKLVETAALGKPCLVYGSEINKQFLGEDYPFFVNDPSEVSHIIENFEFLAEKSKDILLGLATKVAKEFAFSSLKKSISTKLDEDNESSLSGKKIVISGHDLKFIYSYITYLRRNGAEVAIDPWEWGESVSLRLSEKYSNWGDYIFCEWGLANAVWHSKNKKEGKKLFVRIHAQEVRKKAAKFGRAINATEVDKLVFVSSLIRRQALEMFGWDEEKTQIIPNGVKKNRFYDPDREIKPVLGMVGIVPTTKRLDRALDLLEALNVRGWEAKLYCKGHRPEDLPFMLAPGRRQELAYYEALYERIDRDPNLKGCVFFDGWGNDVEQWYQKVDFILSPSDNESFHYALADGVMAGCIPLVWPWENAAGVYSPDWIVSDSDEALEYIQKYLSSSTQSTSRIIELNQRLISSRYGEVEIFNNLSSLFRK